MKPSHFAVAALMAAASQAQGAPTEWSRPVVTTDDVGLGVTRHATTSERTYKDKGGHRIWEDRADVELMDKRSLATFKLLKRQEFANSRIVSLYRNLETIIPSADPFAILEQSEISKTKDGFFKSTLFREYYSGDRRKGQACRVTVRIEPLLLVTNYTVKLYGRQENGLWPALASATQPSLAQAIWEIKKQLRAHEASQSIMLPDVIMTLWTASMMSNEALDMTQLLYPFLGSGAQPGQLDTESMIVRSHERLAAMGLRTQDLKRWESVRFKLAQARREKNIGNYRLAAEKLAESPTGEAPSSSFNLQATTHWVSDLLARLRKSNPKGSLYRGELDRLAEESVKHDADFKANVYVHALNLLLIGQEVRALGQWAKAEEADASIIRETRETLIGAASQWRAVAQNSGGIRFRFPFVADAWASVGDDSLIRNTFQSRFSNSFQRNPYDLSLESRLVAYGVNYLPNKPDDFEEISRKHVPTGRAFMQTNENNIAASNPGGPAGIFPTGGCPPSCGAPDPGGGIRGGGPGPKGGAKLGLESGTSGPGPEFNLAP